MSPCLSKSLGGVAKYLCYSHRVGRPKSLGVFIVLGKIRNFHESYGNLQFYHTSYLKIFNFTKPCTGHPDPMPYDTCPRILNSCIYFRYPIVDMPRQFNHEVVPAF
jgi:hypothetical protein